MEEHERKNKGYQRKVTEDVEEGNRDRNKEKKA